MHCGRDFFSLFNIGKKVRADESEMVWKAQNKKFEKLDAGDLLL